MDITHPSTPLPTTCLAVEAHLKSLVPPTTLEVLERDGGSAYPFMFGMATALLAQANAEIVRLRVTAAQVTLMRDTLGDVHDLLDDYSDVIDGEDGPRPNRAMSMMQTVESVLERVKA